MVAKKKDDAGAPIEILEVRKDVVDINIVGTSPVILNRMSQKVQRELLLPRGRKTNAEKQANAKHNPVEEFLASPYTMRDNDCPSYLALMPSAFKGAMRTAALDLPGSSKAQIGRLIYVEGDLVPLFGLPKLFMSITRSADINKTPDVRTRAIVPRWAAILRVSFVAPIMRLPAVINLLSAGGITSGIGDWRPEKGKGDYGQYRIANDNDSELLEILAEGGREAQIEAMKNPVPYDLETEELLTWYDEEATRRGFKA